MNDMFNTMEPKLCKVFLMIAVALMIAVTQEIFKTFPNEVSE